MDPVTASRPYASVPTDTILGQTMEQVGDHDPSTIQKETGAPLHFTPSQSANLHRAANTGNGQAVKDAAGEAMGTAREKVTERIVEGVAEMSEKFGPALSGASFALGSVVQLGSLYYSGIEKAKHEGDNQRALGASDAGVTALAQSLNYSPGFKSAVASAHAGSSNVAAAMTTALASNSSERSELQLRSDKGFVDAAGYARNAAAVMRPLYDQAQAKNALAAQTADPGTASALRSQAAALITQAQQAEQTCMAPLLKSVNKDAAYGLGVLYAVHCAMQSPATLDAAFSKANANITSVGPSTIHIQG